MSVAEQLSEQLEQIHSCQSHTCYLLLIVTGHW